MREELIEDLATGSNSNNAGQPSKEAVVRKLLGKRECARIDLALDFLEPLASAAQIGLRWRTSNKGAVSNAFKHEIELDSAVGRCCDTPCKPLAAHRALQEA